MKKGATHKGHKRAETTALFRNQGIFSKYNAGQGEKTEVYNIRYRHLKGFMKWDIS